MPENQDVRPHLVDAASDILATCDRMLELLNAGSPYSMSQAQFGVAMDVNSIGFLAKGIIDRVRVGEYS
ncbi:MAG: hypothetical protein ACFN4K_04960 [Pauljensenia sp.]